MESSRRLVRALVEVGERGVSVELLSTFSGVEVVYDSLLKYERGRDCVGEARGMISRPGGEVK